MSGSTGQTPGWGILRFSSAAECARAQHHLQMTKINEHLVSCRPDHRLSPKHRKRVEGVLEQTKIDEQEPNLLPRRKGRVRARRILKDFAVKRGPAVLAE